MNLMTSNLHAALSKRFLILKSEMLSPQNRLYSTTKKSTRNKGIFRFKNKSSYMIVHLTLRKNMTN